MVLSPFMEQAVANAGAYGLGGIVHEQEGQAFVMLLGGTKQVWMVVFATPDGAILEAYRAPTQTASDICGLFSGAASAGHAGALIANDSTDELGGVVHAFGDPAEPISFDSPAGIGLQGGGDGTAMTKGRFAWLGPLDSVATADGSDFTPVALPPGWTTVDSLDTDGTSFLVGGSTATEDGGAGGVVATTDGKSSLSPYLTPTDGSIYDYAVYAGGYVAWLRGIGWQNDNLYTKVEVWASAYDPQDPSPAKLSPYKVTDYPFVAMARLIGAGGRVAFLADDTGTTMAVWDLKAMTRTLHTLPANQAVSEPVMGITSSHLWLKASPIPAASNATDIVVRFLLP
jgi:hypothetical protein